MIYNLIYWQKYVFIVFLLLVRHRLTLTAEYVQ